ncbi:MAG: DUF5722 domain-containing protein [Planctomycetota bacterium]
MSARLRLPALAALALALPLAAQRTVDLTPYPAHAGKKGLQVQMVDDALALGVKQAGINVSLGALIDVAARDDSLRIELDGRTFCFHRGPVAALDAQIGPLSKAGVVVSAILLAIQTGDAATDAVLVHPGCTGRAPNGIAAFRTTDAEGRAWLRATITFLAERYSGAATPHGRVWNWIVGNEVNSHWWWYHMGKATTAEVAAAYEAAVRIVHDAVASRSQNGRVFVSLEHHWNVRYAAGDASQACAGRELLEAFVERARGRGDFAWHVAFHPYPEDLFDCRFWQDETAPDRDDAPRVTFKNLPVLSRWLDDPAHRFAAAPRRVILSEQGFHCRDDQDGERDQAAAYALAWSIVSRLDGIDAFILHRHVDHAHEGGLRLGLWSRRADSVCTPERRRRIGDVFVACDTDAWPECAAFALPVLGLARFDDWPLGYARRPR